MMRCDVMMARPRSALGVLALLLACGTGDLVADVTAAELTFVLQIAKGHVPPDMRLIRVNQGDVVRLKWSSDHSVIVHLHGYDIEKVIEPGRVTELIFTAGVAGRFPLNLHSATQQSRDHGHEETLVFIEVYPR
jgi:hypothetical protein